MKSLYGNILRFLDFEKSNLVRFGNELKNYEKECYVDYVNRPGEGFLSNFHLYVYTGLFIFFVAGIFVECRDYLAQQSKLQAIQSTLNIVHPDEAIIMNIWDTQTNHHLRILGCYVVIPLITIASILIQINVSNSNRRGQTISLDIQNKIISFCNKNHGYFSEKNLQTLRNGNISYGELKVILQNTLNFAQGEHEESAEFLKQFRFKPFRQINMSQIPIKNQRYMLFAAKAWGDSHTDEKILSDDSILEKKLN